MAKQPAHAGRCGNPTKRQLNFVDMKSGPHVEYNGKASGTCRKVWQPGERTLERRGHEKGLHGVATMIVSDNVRCNFNEDVCKRRQAIGPMASGMRSHMKTLTTTMWSHLKALSTTLRTHRKRQKHSQQSVETPLVDFQRRLQHRNRLVRHQIHLPIRVVVPGRHSVP